MSKKFIFVDTNGDYEESAGAYETADFIGTSAGGADAGKPVVLDGTGKIDASMLDLSDVDHGGISGLGDDDHTQYTLADGSRAFTGPQSMGGNKLTSVADGTSATDGINKGQLDSAVSGLQDFRESVIDKDLLTPPGGPTTGDRYIVGQPTDTATGAWVGLEGTIQEWNGSAWVEDSDGAPDEGTFVYVEDENAAYIFNNDVFASGSWVVFSSGVLSAGDGIDIAGNVVSVDFATTSGLKFVSSELAVEPADFAGTGLQDDGADNLEIDFADTTTEMGTSRAVAASDLSTNGASQGAKIIGADPATIAVSSATTVQGVLEDLDNAIAAASTPGESFTSGVGGVSAGDLVFIDSNDTVLPMPITSGDYSVGIAMTSEAATAAVKVNAENARLDGVLVGATAGTKYYWNGTALTSTIPATSGNYVWLAGVARNSTDLSVHVEFVKKNA